MLAIKIGSEKFVISYLHFLLDVSILFFQASSDGMYMDRDLCNTLSQLLEPNVSNKSKFNDFDCTKKKKCFMLKISFREFFHIYWRNF